jgi:hypothetical protein
VRDGWSQRPLAEPILVFKGKGMGE